MHYCIRVLMLVYIQAKLGKLPSMLEVENLMAAVSETAPLSEEYMLALRESYRLCKAEYSVRTDMDKTEVARTSIEA
jgi:hypothetical protein